MDEAHAIPSARALVLSELEAQLLESSVRSKLFGPGSPEVPLGRYRLVERLGRGGMGVVFAAHDDVLDRRVAIKLLHGSPDRADRTSLVRLRREAQALARLSHPNVVQVFEVGEAQGHAFVAMELVPGVTLRTWLEQRRRRTAEIVDVFVQAGRGLAAAHAAGLVHRDFKPENVLVGDDGRVRVADFGLVREGEVAGRSAPVEPTDVVTRTGAVMGTPAYMAPEQRQGTGSVDARSDQFAFCVALHEALCGRRPSPDGSVDPIVRSAADRVPRRVRRAIGRGLSLDPAARWPAMDPLLAALDPRRARWRALGLGGAGALAAAAAVAAGSFVLDVHRERERERVAEMRLAQIAPRIEERLDASDRSGAEELLAALAVDPDLRDTAAPGRAWALFAGMLEAREQASHEAWASAFVRTRDADSRRSALASLVRAYGARHLWHGVCSALALLADEAPDELHRPDLVELRFAAAGARRDLAGALALTREPHAPAAVTGLDPVLEAWSAMAPTVHEDVHGVQVLGSTLLLDVHAPEPHGLVVAADASLTPRRREARARLFAGGGASGLVLQDDGIDHTLLAWTPAGVRELLRLPAGGSRVMQTLAVDLDGDGREEVWVAEQAGLRAWLPDATGEAWRRVEPHAATNATRSNGDGLAAGDLDGDGQPELVAVLGPWSAYDVRVFGGAGSDEAHLIARGKLGHSGGVRVFASAAGPRILALATESYPNTTVFPEPHAHGAAEGLYVLRLVRGGLEIEQFLPIPDTAEADLLARCVFSGDVDGDGLEDVIVRVDQRPTGVAPAAIASWVLRQRPDGTFAQLVLAGIEPLGLAQLDGDPAEELLFVPHGDRRLWVAGLGGSMVPPLEVPNRDLADRHADDLHAAGAPADVVALARAGAADLALAVGLQLVPTADEQIRPALALAAARIAGDLGHARQVVDLLATPPAGAATGAEAAERLTRAYLALGHEQKAAAALGAWLARPDLDPSARARAEALREPLETFVWQRRAVALTTSGPDAPAKIDPVAVRRADDGGLVLEAFVGGGAILEWTLDGSEGPLGAEIALSPTVAEWSAGLELRLRAGDGAVARAGLRVHGGDVAHHVLLVCGPREVALDLPVGPAGDTAPVRLRVSVDPTRGLVACAATGPRGLFVLQHAIEGSFRGPVALEIGPEEEFGSASARLQTRLDAVEVLGARVHPAEPDRVAAALVEADGAGALRLLSGPGEPTTRVLRALALTQLGRLDAAARELAAAPDDDALRRLLVARPERFAPVLRQALGDERYFRCYAQARALVLRNRRFTPAESGSLTADLAGVEEACIGEVCGDLLAARGRAHAQRGDRERAGIDLARALERARGPQQIASLHVELAALAAREGDSPRVLAHASAALRGHAAVEIVRDVLRARPELRPPDIVAALAPLLGSDDRLGLNVR